MTQYNPHSYFFTDLAFTQFSGTNVPDVNTKSFGPLDENRFQITTTFTQSLKAYAVTGGVLLIAKQAGATNRINIFLKPTQDIGLGIKIKYFVYRGIDATDYFKDVSGTVLINESSNLNFINKAWDAYVEFNQTTADFTATKVGVIDGSGGLNTELIKKYFTTATYNLLKVDAGAPLGKFVANAGGFEIVLDEGDYSQDSSDTGLDFDLSFIVASSSILTTKDSTTPNLSTEFGTQTNTILDAKIFKENIYKFLDPAAFYGSHVIDNMNSGKISIGGSSTVYQDSEKIFTDIVDKFSNKNKVYIYIKGKVGRSFEFYNATQNIRINLAVLPFKNNSWPIFIRENNINPITQIGFEIIDSVGILYSNIIVNNAYLFKCFKNGNYSINFPFYQTSSTKKYFSGFAFICFQNGEDTALNELFGPINLNTIFEEEDFVSSGGLVRLSWINSLRPVLKSKGNEYGLYYTKVVFDYTNTDDAKKLKTFFVAPIYSTIQENPFSNQLKDKNQNAAYLAQKAKSSAEYCNNVLGIENSEIWRGIINDPTDGSIYSLALRTDKNINNFDSFTFGITEKEYKELIKRLPKDAATNKILATNILFYLGPNISNNQLYYSKYKLQLQYDDLNGNRDSAQITTTLPTQTEIYIYSTDNQFFFTKQYSANFNAPYYSEFADTTVDFRPQNKWMQYFNYPLTATKTTLNDSSVFYGFDWLRKGDSEQRLSAADNYLQYKISELYQTSSAIYHNFFENIAENPNGDDPATTVVNKKLYVDVKATYRTIPMNWKLPDGPLFLTDSTVSQTEPNDTYDKDYSPSWLNIPRDGSTNPAVKLRLKIRKRNNVYKELKLYFDQQYFKIKTLGTLAGSSLVASIEVNNNVNVGSKINTQPVGVVKFKKEDLPSGGSTKMKWIDFELENIASVNQLSIISVWADGKLAGKLYVVPNNTAKEKNILIIKVQDTASTTGTYDSNEIEILKKFASVCNIKIKEEVYSGILDLRLNTTFQQFIITRADTTKAIDYEKIVSGNITFDAYIKKLITETKYNNYIKIFYFGLPCMNSTATGGELAHTSEQNGVISMFNTLRNYTSVNQTRYFYVLSHEFLHSQGVSHSFSAMVPSAPNALLTFMTGTTNNVMDYDNDKFDVGNPAYNMFIQSVFFWHWAVAYKYSIKIK